MINELFCIIQTVAQAILNSTKPTKTNSSKEGLILRKNKEKTTRLRKTRFLLTGATVQYRKWEGLLSAGHQLRMSRSVEPFGRGP